LRLREIAVAVYAGTDSTDWGECLQLWRSADGVAGRDVALAAMPVTAIDLDDLPTAELAPIAGLILAGRSDQSLLAVMQDKLRGYLDKGRVVVFSGQLTHDWLPGATAFEPGRSWAANRDRPNCTTTRSSPVRRPTTSARPFSTRTAGIVSRSAADVIAQRADGTPGAYVDQTSTGGTVLLHGGANLLANATTSSSAARIAPQLIDWVRREAHR
jgi:hypothetical protein